MRAAWCELEHAFSLRRNGEEGQGEKNPDPRHLLREHPRLPNDLLTRFPVNLLTIKQASATLPPVSYERKSWEKVITRTAPTNQPRVVVEACPPNAQLWTKGPACKSVVNRWHDMEYVSRYKRVSATDVGGAINQARLLVARVELKWSHL
jgi:hypothetical protein